MVTEDFCSPEVTNLLKEKGFGEYTGCGRYHMKGDNLTVDVFLIPDAPTHQSAMKWLRKIHNIIFVFKPASFSGEECTSWTYEIWAGDNFEGETMSFKTYEEAVEAALKYSLENLI